MFDCRGQYFNLSGGEDSAAREQFVAGLVEPAAAAQEQPPTSDCVRHTG